MFGIQVIHGGGKQSFATLAGYGGGFYTFPSCVDAQRAIDQGWSQFSAAWKKRHLRVVDLT